jgi:FkbM family methyltransferase
VIRARRRLARRRRRAYERFGSERLSRPALYDMERKLEPFLPSSPGFFVEAGANDGFEQSNTYWLERFRGWRGLLVEPIPELCEEARAERPGATVVNCALVAPDYADRTVAMRYGGLMSLVSGTGAAPDDEATWSELGTQYGWDEAYDVDVPARTLSSVLDEAGAPAIDLLSLDVEGYEALALAGLDLERHAPALILVEMHDPDAMRPGIEAVIGSRYGQAEQLSPLDFLYRRAT